MNATPDAALAGPEVTLPFELEALANALRYQEWVYDTIKQDLGSRVLEIGAGAGNISRWLTGSERLILTETDPMLLGILQKNISQAKLPADRLRVEQFDVIKDPIERFAGEGIDTIVSFNVLEHIEDDETALRNLCEILRRSTASAAAAPSAAAAVSSASAAAAAPGAPASTAPRRLVCFVPAHGWALGSIDRHFGHFRRYSAGDFRRLAAKVAPEARLRLRYFNAFGLLGWVLQGKVLRRQSFGLGSIHAFEALCPVIRPIDDFLHLKLGLPFGQSLLAVLEWPAPAKS